MLKILNSWLNKIPSERLPFFLFFCLFLPVIIFLIVFASHMIYEYNTLKSWKSVTGKIIKADLEYAVNEDFKYYLDIEYTYSVNGESFTESRINIVDDSYALDEAKEKLQDYTVGKDITVFYNPENPERAVLNKGLSFQFFVIVFAALAFTWGGFYILRLVFT